MIIHLFGRAFAVLFLVITLFGCGSDSDSTSDVNTTDTSTFKISSSAIVNGELLSTFQCEEKTNGVEDSLPLSWENVPAGTQSLAVTMTHYPNTATSSEPNSYLLLWNISPTVTGITHGGADNGSWYMGSNKDGNTVSYTSPCSPSAGSHEYTLTLYALAEAPALPNQSTADVTYSVLKNAIDAAGTVATTSLTFNSTTSDSTTTSTTASTSARCDGFLSTFANLGSLVTAECLGNDLALTTQTGLPPTRNVPANERIMVGITSWINRVPMPYTYAWNIPMQPNWSASTIEASAKGPIAVAIDGVPIFHYERRPDVSTALSNYTAENDTVLQGELDQCGGHSGQGEDYHYHYTPVCLLDGHDLSKPIAFGLDGAAVYYGEGGTAFYGNGQYNKLSNFPAGITAASLDECNAVQQGDGSYAHYSTKTPPYLIGCHHAAFDTALQIEPRPIAGRDQRTATPLGGQYGEPSSTLITDFNQDDAGNYTMTFNALNGSGTSAIIYKQVSATSTQSCWSFEFRQDASQQGESETVCRDIEQAQARTAMHQHITATHSHQH